MKTDPLKQFVALRAALMNERTRLEARLAEINRALAIQPPARATAKANNALSLREAIIQATRAKPLSKGEILKAVQALGYKFTARDPMNSLNVMLYTPGHFKNTGGKWQAIKKGKKT